MVEGLLSMADADSSSGRLRVMRSERPIQRRKDKYTLVNEERSLMSGLHLNRFPTARDAATGVPVTRLTDGNAN